MTTTKPHQWHPSRERPVDYDAPRTEWPWNPAWFRPIEHAQAEIAAERGREMYAAAMHGRLAEYLRR